MSDLAPWITLTQGMLQMNTASRGLLSLLIIGCLSACSGENAEKSAAGAVSKAVELAKGAATGVGKGVDEGRKASTSADGAQIVTNGAELRAALSGKVLEATPTEGSVRVTLGFENAGAVPVRVTELGSMNNVTALDKDGYACTTQMVEREFTVPAKAKLKVDASFSCSGTNVPAKVRVFDVEYAVTGKS